MNIAIASGKGGTGKTTLAVNMASFLSDNIHLKLKKEVVLADIDVEEPNDFLYLNGKLIFQENKYRAVPSWNAEKCVLCGKCKEVCNFNAITRLPEIVLIFTELCKSCYACVELCPQQALQMINKEMGVLKRYLVNSNLTLVESTLNIGEVSAVPLIKQTKAYIKSKFSNDSMLIFDCPPGTSCPVIESVKDADLVILVTEPTPFGLHDLKLAVKTVKKLHRNFIVVINKYDENYKEVENYCNNNNIVIAGRIPVMRKIAELSSHGKLIYHIPEVESELDKIINTSIKMIDVYERDCCNIG